MILEGRFAPGVTRRSMAVAAFMAVLILAPFIETTSRDARAGSGDEAPPPAGQPRNRKNLGIPVYGSV